MKLAPNGREREKEKDRTSGWSREEGNILCGGM